MSDFAYSFDYWWALVLGHTPPRIPPDRVAPGFYSHYRRNGEMVGVAVWIDNGRPVVKYAGYPAKRLISRADEEDWSFRTFSFLKPVPHDAYVKWAATGQWPAEIIEREFKPRKPRKSKKSPQQTEEVQ
jgi:hypothetical protein